MDYFFDIIGPFYLSHLLYIFNFGFLLAPILLQSLFLYIIGLRKLRLIITIFLTEGLIVLLAPYLYERKSSPDYILSILSCIFILLLISLLICMNNKKLNIADSLLFLSSYGINILTVLFLIKKFGILINW